MSKSVAKLFGGKAHAAIYAKFRPVTPGTVATRIIQYLGQEIVPPFERAVDVGCGSGQSTRFLASYFKEIIGIDVSEAQIKEAQKEAAPNILYKVGQSETIPLQDGTAQLITASQAHHWFNVPAFLKEANRLLVRNGVLCFYWYSLPLPAADDDEKTTALQNIVHHAYRVDSIKYWDVRRQTVDKGFDGLPYFPFRDVVRENVYHESDITLADYIGYVSSWSAYQDMKRDDENKAKVFIEKMESSMIEAIGVAKSANDINIKLQLKYYIMMGRKSATQQKNLLYDDAKSTSNSI